MANQQYVEHTEFDWQPCSFVLPRVGLIVSRYGPRTRVIMPGHYMVRRSRSLGQRIYRRA